MKKNRGAVDLGERGGEEELGEVEEGKSAVRI